MYKMVIVLESKDTVKPRTTNETKWKLKNGQPFEIGQKELVLVCVCVIKCDEKQLWVASTCIRI